MGQVGNEGKEFRLIDFLYKDEARASSFYAQLLGGSLKQVAVGTQEAVATSRGLGGGIPFLSGEFSGTETNQESIVKTLVPHDQTALDLLDILAPRQLDIIPDDAVGQVALLKGTIAIRNYKLISEALPILFQVMESAPKKQDQRQITSMLKLIPMGLELELLTSMGEILTGSLKPEYLTESTDDIARIYGGALPDEWYVLGVIDPLNGAARTSRSSEIRQGLDQYSNMIAELYRHQEAEYSIIPIFIFRSLNRSVQEDSL